MNFEDFEHEEEEIQLFLVKLDQLRQQCEQRGDFLRAQECVNRMREVNFRQAQRLQALSKLANADKKADVAGDHRFELASFTTMWEEKLRDYDSRAEDSLKTLQGVHIHDYASQEGTLRMQLMNRRPRFSRSVVDLRTQLSRAIQQRQYVEAEGLKRKLAVCERDELVKFDEGLSATFERKSQGVKKQYVNELRAAEQKVRLGRDELVTQQRADLERLLRRHTNAMKELDTETSLHVAKTKKIIETQITVLANDPVKTGVDFHTVARQVRTKVAASSQQQQQRSGASSGHIAGGEQSSFAAADFGDDADRYFW